MKRSLYIFATLMLLLPFSAKGEEPEGRPSTHATLFALGRANHLDTYLSPMEYTGPQLTFLHTTLRHLKRNEHIVFETATQGEVSYTENQAQTAHYMGGSVRYDFGWGRQWRNVLWKGLELTAGGMAGGDLGFLYNDRNANNQWDTGDYAQRLQPEEVFYFPSAIDVRANWDIEQTWRIHELPLTRQKPAEITKQKGDKKKTPQNRNLERLKKLGRTQ